MPRFIEELLERRLNAYRRQSNILLIVYKTRYNGMMQIRENINRKFKYFLKNLDEIDEKYPKRNEDNSGTTSRTWSSSSEINLSRLLNESSNSSISLHSTATSTTWTPQETFDQEKFPYIKSKIRTPLLYWNIETDNDKYYSGGNIENINNKKRKTKIPPLHIDTISRLRLQSFIRSLCENRNNSNLRRTISPEEDTYIKIPSKQKKRNKKKIFKYAKDSSTVSFHITVPKQTKSILLSNDPITTNSTKDVNDVERKKVNTKDQKNCSYFRGNSNSQSMPSNKFCVMEGSENVTMKVGNQTFTISVKKATDDDEEKKQLQLTQRSTASNKNGEATKKCCCHSKKGNPIANTSTCNKHISSVNKKEKCPCLQKMRRNVEEDMKDYAVSELGTYSGENKYSAEGYEKSCSCGELKNTGKLPQSKYSEKNERDYHGELAEEGTYKENYIRCVKIYVDPQMRIDNENLKKQDDYDNPHLQTPLKKCTAKSLNTCRIKECSAMYGNIQADSEYTDRTNNSRRSSLLEPSSYENRKRRKDKCCSCSNNPDEEENTKCEHRMLKSTPLKFGDKCCQCIPNQDEATQVEMNSIRSIEREESTEDKTSMNEPAENEVNEVGIQSIQNSVAEAYAVNTTHKSSRKYFKSSSVDPKMIDGTCSCCICDEESFGEEEVGSEHTCRSTNSLDDGIFSIYRKNISRRRGIERSCECNILNKRSVNRNYIGSLLKRKEKTDKSEEKKKMRGEYGKKINQSVKQKVTSTEDLIECECEDFEQLLAELEEYCSTNCVHFELLDNLGYQILNNEEKTICSNGLRTEGTDQNMVQNNEYSNIKSPSFLSMNLKSLLEEKASVKLSNERKLRMTDNSIISVTSKSRKPKNRWPRKLSSRLSDQRLNRMKNIESRCRISRIQEQIGFLIL